LDRVLIGTCNSHIVFKYWLYLTSPPPSPNLVLTGHIAYTNSET
jgi:hypothetical protein